MAQRAASKFQAGASELARWGEGRVHRWLRGNAGCKVRGESSLKMASSEWDEAEQVEKESQDLLTDLRHEERSLPVWLQAGVALPERPGLSPLMLDGTGPGLNPLRRDRGLGESSGDGEGMQEPPPSELDSVAGRRDGAGSGKPPSGASHRRGGSAQGFPQEPSRYAGQDAPLERKLSAGRRRDQRSGGGGPLGAEGMRDADDGDRLPPAPRVRTPVSQGASSAEWDPVRPATAARAPRCAALTARRRSCATRSTRSPTSRTASRGALRPPCA
jgi:hypothetical protein